MQDRILNLILLITILLAVFFDLKRRKIYNFITIPSTVIGILVSTSMNGISGFNSSILGLLTGLFLLVIPFILGGMGGGDVKLMAAIGALKGWRFVLSTAIFSGLAGGVIVIILLMKQKKVKVSLKRVLAIILKPIMYALTLTFENKKLEQFNNWLLDSQINWEKQYIPYGVAIGIGAMITLFVMR